MRIFTFLSLLIIVVESANSHSSKTNSHARRSMDVAKFRGGLGGRSGLGSSGCFFVCVFATEDSLAV